MLLSVAPPDEPKTRPGELRSWLLSFPSAGAFDLGRAIVDYLAGVNASVLTLDERLGLLELARSRAEGVLRELEAIYGASGQPMEAHAREALELSRTISSALASGYNAAAVGKAAEGIRVGATTKLAPLVLGAMRYLGKTMRSSYKCYARVPKDTWRQMHAQYLFAERRGIATVAADAESGATITEFYCEALLLALTDPYRLVPGELEPIEALIREVRAPLTLGREPPITRATCHFMVGADEDAPPKPLREAKDGKLGEDTRILDASVLVDRLRAMLAQSDRQRDTSFQRALVNKLIALWDDPPKRAFRRDPAQGSVAICVGVTPIAQFVAHDSTADGEAETKALREGITMPLRALPEDETGKAIPIHEWAVINMSAGGVRVRRSASTAYPITVGEVVGIRAPGKVLWTIGVTRWITALEEGTTEFGVQFFANAICAVWFKHSAPSSPRQLGLLVAEGEDNSEESLLAPPDTYTESGEFALRGEGFRSRVRAARLIEGNAHFELFRVEPS